jgi:hypothetical protein
VDSVGNVIVPAIYNVIQFLDDFIIAHRQLDGDILLTTFLYNSNGELLNSGQFDFDSSSREGLYIFHYFFNFPSLQRHHGVMNSSGVIVIPAEYDLFSSFNSGLATGLKNGQWYVFDAVQPPESPQIDEPMPVHDISIIFEPDTISPSHSDMGNAVSVMQRRINDYWGFADIIVTYDHRHITVLTPMLQDNEQFARNIGRTGFFAIKDDTGNILLTGEDIASAYVNIQEGMYIVVLNFTATGASAFEEATRNNLGRTLNILIDDEVLATPIVNAVIPVGVAIIAGNFTRDEAVTLASLINAGSLPFSMSVIAINHNS